MRIHPRRAMPLALATGVALSLVPASGAAAANPDYPAGWEGFHTHAEMTTVIRSVAAAKPSIVRVVSIGKSHQGLDIWAAKVSDNVAVDESEPEVLYDGQHHGDEHMSKEMTIRILRWLADGYGSDARITSIVNSREIWIVFSVNPDGAEYDIAGGQWHHWRKNRQPTPGSTWVGTDLNRNYDYHWGSGGRTSADPSNSAYRGPAPFSAPEARVFADFLASRVINGRQQIRTAITFHEFGRLVMWPYGYTTADLPVDMTSDDLAAFGLMGRAMAKSNGYAPHQASDLYVSAGTSRDYMYGKYRIFVYTFEMSARDYPDDSLIAAETGRNRESALYLAERAWCPLSVLGATVMHQRCGVLDDDLEVWRGWRVNPLGTDTATRGAWQQGDLQPTSYLGAKQAGTTPSGRFAFATGVYAGASTSAEDLDGGVTTVETRPFTLSSRAGQRLDFRWTFAHYASATSADYFRVQVVPASGSPIVVHDVRGAAVDRDAAWTRTSVSLDAWAGQTVRLRFSAADASPDGLVEAAFDDVRVTRPS
jgi:hypothetical protein